MGGWCIFHEFCVMRRRVLFVAKELELRARFARRLQSSGYAIELASDEQRALRLAAECDFHVAIIAPAPSLGSLATMQELRDRVPEMIVLAEGPDEMSHLRRSLSGIQAFFLKTSDEGAVITRVGEVTAPAQSESSAVSGILCLEDCKLDLAGCVFVDASGREAALTRAELSVLKELASSPCQVLSREKLRHAVSGRGVEPFDRSIDMLIARLRRKIESDPKAARFLVTVPGVGYKLMVRPRSADVRPSGAEPAAPERRQLTAFACNLEGAMGLAVKFDPEDLSRINKDFQDVVVAAIARMGGTITSVAPDQILALFGYPEALEDAAERAVDAGLDAVTKIGQLQAPLGEPLQVQVAVATGLALACAKQVFGEPRASHLTAEVKLVQSLSNSQEPGDDGAINDRETGVRVEHSADRSLRRQIGRKPSERHPIRAASVTGPGRRKDWAQEAQAPARHST
jgi:DNA-binding response OmpR family regulator